MTPFYCDPARVGAFAVPLRHLARGTEAATFRLFVTLTMYQALRDVVVMRRQRLLPRAEVDVVASLQSVRTFRESDRCVGLRDAASVIDHCDVWKRDGRIDCGRHPGVACEVKAASRAFNRMGDFGKLPTSAYEVGWAKGGLRELLHRTMRAEASPQKRAHLLVTELQHVHRVGRKLATMFVSSLATPALAPKASPWFPAVDGNALVIVDTNVARAVDVLRAGKGLATYDAREDWICRAAGEFDLRRYDSRVPGFSPRILQQALYTFCSKSNRRELGDSCSRRMRPCSGCARHLCPFASEPRVGEYRRPRAHQHNLRSR
jgi:hypothetical protein